MPKFSISSSRKSRRYSSESGLLSPPALSTLDPSDSVRPSSSSRVLHKPTGGASINEVLEYNNRLPRPRNGASPRRPSDHSATRPQDLNDAVPNRNRWSSSTASSNSATNHRRRSSFSKRFSLGASSLNSGFRSMSPNKARQPSEGPPSSYLPKAPTVDSIAAPLPSFTRFSPLTLPSVTYGSGEKSQAPTRSLSPPPVGINETTVLQNIRGAEDSSNGTISPQKRHREPASRGGSHLSDILEIDRNQVAMSSPRMPATSGSPVRMATDERSRSRRGTSRETSPTKHKNRTNQTGTQSSSQPAEQGSPAPAERRSRKDKDKDKRSILARALKRANEAVLLDNEQSYIKAVAAYEEACELLDLVMARTHTESERAKLTTIRGTYLSRIQDLQHIHSPQVSRVTDDSTDSAGAEQDLPVRDSTDGSVDEDIRVDFEPPHMTDAQERRPSLSVAQLPSRSSDSETTYERPVQRHIGQTLAPILTRTDNNYMPPPPSPSRMPTEPIKAVQEDQQSLSSHRESGIMHGPHDSTSDAGSWFNAAGDEVVSSAHSPNHSVDDLARVRRKDLRDQALSTEAEFDAALDAAIESAYPDGFEPYEGEEYDADIGLATSPPSRTSDPLTDQAQSYIQRQAHIQRLSQRSRNPNDSDTIIDISENDSGIDSEEEDRLLDAGRESTDIQEHNPEPKPQQHVPRQSDSSGYSGRTWGSSAASSLNTAGTSLGTVDENVSLPSLPPKPYISKNTTLQAPEPLNSATRETQLAGNAHVGDASEPARSRSPLRDRRLSAQKAKGQLRIETSVSTDASPDRSRQNSRENLSAAPEPAQPSQLNDKLSPESTTSSQARSAFRLNLNRLHSPYPSPYAGAFPQDPETPPTPGLQKTLSNESSTHKSPYISPPRKSNRPAMHPNVSSMSLGKHVLQGGRTPDEHDDTANTTMNFDYPASMSPPRPQESKLGQPMTTPLDGTFGSPPIVSSAKMKIFDNEIHSATLPGAPNPGLSDGPTPLEPCPQSTLLRPFWLMRCFYQTMAHPKGGYVTTKLFVPHDVWKVKNVKLKSVEEKIANCDLLTAALLKLSGVNTLDADAVLEEMQSFEAVLDQAQTSLAKKLGNEVGVYGISNLFKEAPTGSSPLSGDPNATHNGTEGTTASTGGKTSSKGYLHSWRKLRSKSSSTNLATSYAASRELSKDAMLMNSLPMTTNIAAQRHVGKRERSASGSKRFSAIQVDGPNANYAGALARLCDAAQVLDQIARQVEDPGLKLSSPTHVGLELSTRHASEFFGFYICRFILQDLIMLTEKFIKRASEWVVA